MKCKHCGEELRDLCYETIYHHEDGTTEVVYFCNSSCELRYSYPNGYDPFEEPAISCWSSSHYIEINN